MCYNIPEFSLNDPNILSLNDIDLDTGGIRNVFVSKEHLILMILTATKYNDNITTHCAQITLNMRK